MNAKEKKKTIKISESVHTKLKVHVAKEKSDITKFADEAITLLLKNKK